MTDHDRAEVEFFADFLRRVGPPSWMHTPEGRARVRAWVAEDPEPRLEYLGLPNTPEWQEIRAGLLAESD